MSKPIVQEIKDLIGAPLRLILLPDEASRRLGLTSLEDERFAAVLPWISGRLLDIGAGSNRLVQIHGNGCGIDVHDFGGGAMVVDNVRQLPFPDSSFDTITFLASLNHIPERSEALVESHRVLREAGRIVVTMIDPILSSIGHRIWWYSEDKHRGGMRAGEVFGFWPSEMRRLLQDAGFKVVAEQRFVYGLNRLYVGQKVLSPGEDRVAD